MKKLLILGLAVLMTIPLFGGLRFGVGIGPGILPPSNLSMHAIDEINGKWIEMKENKVYESFLPGGSDSGFNNEPLTAVTYNEIGPPIGILGGLQGIVSGNNFIANLNGVYLTSTGGKGDISVTFGAPVGPFPAGSITSVDIDQSVSSFSFTLTGGPKVQVSELTSVYLQLGLGYTSLTANEKMAMKAPTGEITTYTTEYTGSGLFIPMIIGAEVKLMNNFALGMDASYSSGTLLAKGKTKITPTPTGYIEQTATTSIDLTGLAMLVTIKYYF